VPEILKGSPWLAATRKDLAVSGFDAYF